MSTLSIANRDMMYSLSWYMSARKTALRSALSYRTPLSVTDQTDMRVHYSGYFLNLMAATELFRETTSLQPNEFETRLYSSLVFDKFEDGEANYSYIRELRNAIVHRGLNIASAAHFDGDLPMILAEPKIQNQRKSKTFLAFDKYLLHVIAKCESVVGPVMHDCLKAAGVFDSTLDTQAAVSESRLAIEQSHAIPENIKSMALASEFQPEWIVAVHNSAIMMLSESLVPFDIAVLN